MGMLSGKKVAILTENGFEEVELTSPKQAMEAAGAVVQIVSPQKGKVRAWDNDHWSIELPVDVTLDQANAEEYDALFVPGGVINPDKMRVNPDCVDFAQQFLESGKLLAAICHGPQLLIESGLLQGRKLTSYPSIRTDLENAGASWTDEEVVFDDGLLTSRSPKDLAAFNRELIDRIAEGIPATSDPVF
jgi:protease I